MAESEHQHPSFGAAPSGSGMDESLRGRVLVLDPEHFNAAIVRQHLKGTGVDLHDAGSLGEGVVILRSEHFDALIVVFSAIDRQPEELINVFRECGFTGPLVGATTNPDGERAKATLAAGADEIIPLPFTGPSLARVLNACLNGAGGECGPILSLLDHSADTAALIQNYIEHIEHLSQELVEAAEHDDLERLRRGCGSIAQSAGGYGFPPLEEAASALGSMLEACGSIEGASGEFQRLQHICGRLEATPPE